MWRSVLSLQVALCAGYVAVHAELEVLVVKLHSSLDPKTAEELADMNTCGKNTQSNSLCVKSKPHILTHGSSIKRIQYGLTGTKPTLFLKAILIFILMVPIYHGSHWSIWSIVFSQWIKGRIPGISWSCNAIRSYWESGQETVVCPWP